MQEAHGSSKCCKGKCPCKKCRTKRWQDMQKAGSCGPLMEVRARTSQRKQNDFMGFITQTVTVVAFSIIATVTFWLAVSYYVFKFSVKIYNSNKCVQSVTLAIIAFLVVSISFHALTGKYHKKSTPTPEAPPPTPTPPPPPPAAPAPAPPEQEPVKVPELPSCPPLPQPPNWTKSPCAAAPTPPKPEPQPSCAGECDFVCRYFSWLPFFQRVDQPSCGQPQPKCSATGTKTSTCPAECNFVCKYFSWLPFFASPQPELPKECNFFCRYFSWLPFYTQDDQPSCVKSRPVPTKREKSCSATRQTTSNRKTKCLTDCDFFCKYFNWLPFFPKDDYVCKPMPPDRPHIFNRKPACPPDCNFFCRYFGWLPFFASHQPEPPQQCNFFCRYFSWLPFVEKPVTETRPRGRICLSDERKPYPLLPKECNFFCKYFSWLPFYPRVHKKNITITITDDRAREVYKQSKLYAIPMELKQPPAVLVYLRDVIVSRNELHGHFG